MWLDCRLGSVVPYYLFTLRSTVIPGSEWMQIFKQLQTEEPNTPVVHALDNTYET